MAPAPDASAPDSRRRTIYRPPWRIDVVVRPSVTLPIPPGRLASSIARALAAARAPAPASIGLVLTDDREIARLNRRHMGKSGPTDVLSFPLLAPAAFPRHAAEPADRRGQPVVAFVDAPGRRTVLGDIVVSVERAREQAAAGRGGQTGDVRQTAADELRLLVTHGALHVCGWDHAEPAEEAAMRALERRLLGLAGGSSVPGRDGAQ